MLFRERGATVGAGPASRQETTLWRQEHVSPEVVMQRSKSGEVLLVHVLCLIILWGNKKKEKQIHKNWTVAVGGVVRALT